MSLAADYVVPKALEEWARSAELTTIPQVFRRSVERVGSKNYLGEKVSGTWRFQTYAQISTKVHQFGAAAIELGLQPGDRIASFCNNRPEWVITDLGSYHSGCVHVPMYSTLGESDLAFILQDSNARIVVAGKKEHLEKVLAVEKDCPDLEHIVAVEPVAGKTSTKRLWSMQEFLEFGAGKLAAHQAEIDRRVGALKASDVCSLVYTSGTTGRPKGAMLMHGNFISNAVTLSPAIQVTPEDLELSFLPLSHVFERIAYYVMTTGGASIAYAESVDTVAANLLELNPTIVPSVPRLFEKIHGRVLDQAHGLKGKIMHWALGVGDAYRKAALKGDVPGGLKLQHKIAHKLVFSKIHARTGGKVRFFISGGAPLRRDVGEFFLNAGFVILEGYGLTETSPVLTMNPPEEPRIGTVGKVIPHVEIRIADDGEILARGPNIMMGYFNRAEATAEAIDAEGWFHTGDIGRFDPDGYLMITDRKKELLVMSNGKNVAPQPLEQAIKSSPYIEQAVVIGDNRNFISALVVPAFEKLEGWAKEQGLPANRAELVAHKKVHDLLMAEVETAVKDFSNYEKVKKIAVLPRELTMDDGELTPTLKVKRRVIDQNYKDQIDAIYAGA